MNSGNKIPANLDTPMTSSKVDGDGCDSQRSMKSSDNASDTENNGVENGAKATGKAQRAGAKRNAAASRAQKKSAKYKKVKSLGNFC